MLAFARAVQPRRRVRALGRVVAPTALSAVLVAAWMAPAAHVDVPAEARGIDAACSGSAQQPWAASEHSVAPFSDARGNTHESAINCLAHWEIANGRDRGGDQVYLPGEAVRRDQMASFLARTTQPTDYDLPRLSDEPPPPTDFQPAFTDTQGNVHQANITRLARAGVVEGRDDAHYRPAEPVSRAAMASFIARLIETVTGEELDGGETAFADTRGNVHRDHIQALAARGIVQGHADGSYRPHDAVRRDAMASFVGRAMDYLAAQGHWPVPSAVELSPAEDTDPADFIHRVRGTVYDQWGQDYEHELHGVDVRVEVYRRADGGYELVDASQVVSGPGGDFRAAYNADAEAGDRDVVVACPVAADEHPGVATAWCADVRADADPATVVADGDRDATAVTASWTDPEGVVPARAASYAGNVLAHRPDADTLELQTAPKPEEDPGVEHGVRLIRVGYNAADEFVIDARRRDLPAASLEHFECALQAARAQGDEVYPTLNADYDPHAPSTFELSTQADVGHCVASIPEPFSFEERASAHFPEGGPGHLTAVHPIVQDVADRLVFEVPGQPLGWKVTWQDEPIRRMPSGTRVDVAGEAHLKLQMTAAAEWAEGTYEGPDRIPIDGTVATDAVKTRDFEGQTTWVIGLDRVAPFTVDILSDPQRLVLEVYGGDTEPEQGTDT